MAGSEGTVRIRSATGEDIPLILALIKELAEYEKLSDQVEADEETLRSSLFRQQPPAAYVVIAEKFDGVPVGFALYFFNFSTFTGRPGLYVEDLFIREAYRGRGYGTRLLTHLANIAAERDCKRMEWIVLDWNQSAIRFYRSIGAVGMDGWTIQRMDEDALVKLRNVA
mmetsp:Transcript_13980/g.39748  ORF Transcript_13980/g.39748 Transcript_13980/m.39748 type:complete len:168 (+) Transcript_13980:2-505(+)